MKKQTEPNRMRGFTLTEYTPHRQSDLTIVHRQRTTVKDNQFRTDCSCGGVTVATYAPTDRVIVSIPQRFCPEHGLPMTVRSTTNRYAQKTGEFAGTDVVYRCPFTERTFWIFGSAECSQMLDLHIDHSGRVRSSAPYKERPGYPDEVV